MKKSVLFILAASAMMVSCGGSNNGSNTDATLADSLQVQTVECVASGDVVYIDLDYIMASSALYATEGTALEAKLQEFQQRSVSTQEGWAQREQSLAAEYNRLQADVAKLESDYANGLITTLNAQQKQGELQQKGQSIQTRMTALQNTVQTEGQALQAEEQALAEEQMVIMNRFNALTRMALDEINGDKRYKMIVNAVSVIDADPTLNISELVLERVNALYESGALE